MENIAYQKLLFKAAVNVMASDGEIHQDEIQELQLTFTNTDFFRDISYEKEFEETLSELEDKDDNLGAKILVGIASSSMSPAQELQFLEIILRIIYADGRIDSNELKFLELVKEQLNVPESIFQMRFGDQETIESAKSKLSELISKPKILEDIDNSEEIVPLKS